MSKLLVFLSGYFRRIKHVLSLLNIYSKYCFLSDKKVYVY